MLTSIKLFLVVVGIYTFLKLRTYSRVLYEVLKRTVQFADSSASLAKVFRTFFKKLYSDTG